MTEAISRWGARRPGSVAAPLLCAALLFSAIAVRLYAIPHETHDMLNFLYFWYGYIQAHGHFAAFREEFYNYTPPYLYMLSLGSYLDGLLPKIVIIKSITFVFEGVAGFFIYKIAKFASPSRVRALAAALIFLNLPTVVLNGAVWGQCDIIFTSFLLGAVYFLIRGRPVLAALMYSVALSIKVQAIFLAPFLVYLGLVGVMPILCALLPPIVYMVLVLPAALAGRPLRSLLGIYAHQGATGSELSAAAPTLYVFLQDYLPVTLWPAATLAGILFAALVALFLLVATLKRRPVLTAERLVAAAAMWLAVMPAVLPKMHERYFFAADIMTFVFAIFVPRAWWVAALFQLGSALSYGHFLSLDQNLPIDLDFGAHAGALALFPAILGMLYYYFQAIRDGKAPWARGVRVPAAAAA